jgi:hypothetical protein
MTMKKKHEMFSSPKAKRAEIRNADSNKESRKRGKPQTILAMQVRLWA